MHTDPIDVLLVEDNPGDARFVREMVREAPDLRIHQVDRLAAGLAHLAAERVDVVLLDLGLPDSQGLETLRAILATGSSVPVVVLTGHDDEALGRAAVRDGAQDYLVKGQVAEQALTRAVRYAIERKRAAQALMESEDRFRKYIERTPDGVFMVDDTGRYTMANGSVCRITGYSREELERTSIRDLVADESLEDGLAHFRSLMETGAATSDLWHRRKDGSTCCLTVDAVKLSETRVLGFCKDITARKRAEHSLMASETRYRRLFEAARDGILILDAETGQIVDANPFLLELTGYSLEAFLGKHLWEIGPFKDTASSKQSFAELQTEKYVRYEDLPLQTRDGRKIEVEFVSNVYRVDNQKVIQCNIRDITERKRAEAQMEALARFPEENRSPVLRIGSDGTLLYANPGSGPVLQQWGIEPGQRLPVEWVKLVTDALSDGERHEVEQECRDRSYTFELCPVRTAGYANAYGHDLTVRKRMDRELEDSKQLIESVVENVPLMIFLKEARDLRFVVFNRAGEELLGYDRKDLLGKNDLDLFPPEQAAFFMAKDREVLAGGVPVDIPEEPILTAKQGERLLHTRKVCIKGADGVTKYLLGISEDITERKRAEAKRLELEEQLRVSQKMEAIGSLAGGVAHDFNNLLSVILSYTGFAMEAVREGADPEDDLLEVKKAGEQAAALTRQLLAFSRKQILQPVPLDLNQIAAGVEKMLRRILGEDIDLVQVLAPDLGLVKADPGQLEQVLMNLVVNARDAMPEGGKLTIETSNVEIDEEYAARHLAVTPGPYVQIAVTDTGSGMDAQTRARLFEPFFTTKGKGKGTGLGLSTVYGIVKQSGGNIWVYSEPGRGTTFKIYLPRDRSASAATAIKPQVVPRRATGTEIILVVEDEEALRKVAQRALLEAGYTVLAAADGEEAILTCAEHAGDIQLLLTDVVMPRMSGKALAQALSKTRPALKVLYMSGYTDNAIVHHGVLDAGTHFLGKPFTASELARKVREVLDEGTHHVAGGHEAAARDDAEVMERPLDRAALRGLPEDLLGKLRRAVTAARYDELVDLLETVRITEPDLAVALRRMADLFDHDGLRELLGQRKEPQHGG